MSVDAKNIVNVKSDVALFEGLEPSRGSLENKVADAQFGRSVDSVVVGNGFPGSPGFGVRNGDRGIGNYRSGRISDRPGNGGIVLAQRR